MAQTGLIHDLVEKISDNKPLNKRERREFVAYLRSLEQNTSILREGVNQVLQQSITQYFDYSGGDVFIDYGYGYAGRKHVTGDYAIGKSAAFTLYTPRISQQSGIYITSMYFSTRVNGTSDGSNYWAIQVSTRDEDSGTSPGGAPWAWATAADTGSVWTNHDYLWGTSPYIPNEWGWLDCAVTKTGSPGALDIIWSVEYQHQGEF